MTKKLIEKVKDAVKKAGNDRHNIWIKHRGKYYIISFLQDSNMNWTDVVNVYEHNTMGITETYIGTVKT